MNTENDIQVSVCVVTYNQENYIAECLESLVTQQTNFRFEILVGEDCSTDNTRSIVQSYVDKYPDLFVPLFYEKNLGPVGNLREVYKKARGKYIAHMDGDDMALPGKLQKQYDVMEGNKNCNVCSHDMRSINTKGQEYNNGWTYPENIYNLFDLYHKLPFFAHSSKMFRNKYNEKYWDELLNTDYVLDIDIHISNMIDGDIYHIGEMLGNYRMNVGVSFGKKVNPAIPLGLIRVYKKGLEIYRDDYLRQEKIKSLYAYALLQCAYNYAVFDQDINEFKYYVEQSVLVKKIGFKQNIFKIGTYLPRFYFFVFKIRSRLKHGI